MRIGEKLRMVRLAQGRTLEEIAELTDVHLVTLGQYERGTRPVPYEFIDRVAPIYGIDPERFRAEQPWQMVEAAEAHLATVMAEAQRILALTPAAHDSGHQGQQELQDRATQARQRQRSAQRSLGADVPGILAAV